MVDTALYRISPGGFGEHTFQAHSIGMYLSDQNDAEYYFLPSNGTDIMVTGALSGCSFVVQQGAAGAPSCTHIKPTGGVSGSQLHTTLDSDPNNSVVYGRNDYAHTTTTGANTSPDRNVTIVGVRKPGGWEVYAQKRDTLNSQAVLSVHRVFPA